MGAVTGGGVTFCIPSIPTRGELLRRAIMSVYGQSLPAEAVAVAIDVVHEGAWTTRNRAAMMAKTDWIAFLDDDDTVQPNYIQHLTNFAIEQQADIVWGWFDIVGGTDPFPQYRGRQYVPGSGHVVPITYMAKRDLVQTAIEEMGGFQPDPHGAWDLQDQPILDYMHKLGGVSAASTATVWTWYHHGANTSGLPGRW